jgi:NhaP-type Na+/H+ or K+/H+ antiporter
MWLSGLRGAMAYALALSCSIEFVEKGPIILIVTLIYSLFSILGVGTFLGVILRKLNVRG